MHYEGSIYRPPSEADSILLQVTTGCSHNRCTFCSSFRDKKFSIKSDEIINSDIEFASRHYTHQHRLFLCDGDAMIIPQPRLLGILARIKIKLPWVTRVGIYANAKSLKRKSLDQLMELGKEGLGIVYMGLESGDDNVLKKIQKNGDSQLMIEQGRKVREASLKLSITVLVGLGGRNGSQNHARKTGEVLSAIDPHFVGALSLMIIPGTPLGDAYDAGEFSLLEPEEMLAELRSMIAHTNLTEGLFHANHASNYLPIRAKLPQDKEKILAFIDNALRGDIPLRPEWMRAL